MSDIQNTVTPNADERPSYPAKTGNPRTDSAALHAYEKQTAAWFEKNPEKGYVNHTAVANAPVDARPAATTLNADDAALVRETQADAYARFGAQGNSQVNALVAKMYEDLHSGKRIDRDAYAAQFKEAVATPQSRAEAAAIAELQKHVGADGFVSHDKLTREMRRGYALPAGEYHAEQTVELLKFAQANNVSQDVVDAFVRWQDGGQ